MGADMIAALVGLGVFAALVMGWRLIGGAYDRAAWADVERMTRRKRDAGSFIGGRDRLGE
jgi:hypothetical protein